jgi:hypothetical protein
MENIEFSSVGVLWGFFSLILSVFAKFFMNIKAFLFFFLGGTGVSTQGLHL